MERFQVILNTTNRHAQRLHKVGNQTRKANADTPLPEYLTLEIEFRALPALAVRAVSLDHLMLDHFNRLRRWQLDDLAGVVETLAVQVIPAGGASLQKKPYSTGRRLGG